MDASHNPPPVTPVSDAGHCEDCGLWSDPIVQGLCDPCAARYAARCLQPAVSGYEIETQSGQFVCLLNPDPATIRIDDIAWGLSRANRYAGQTRGAPYSVAHHSLWVAEWLRACSLSAEAQIYGLLHDAHEAYTGDVPTPVKRLLGPVVGDIQARLDVAICKAIGLPNPSRLSGQLIRLADRHALSREANELLPSRGNGPQWEAVLEPGRELPDQALPRHLDTQSAYRAFLLRYMELADELGLVRDT